MGRFCTNLHVRDCGGSEVERAAREWGDARIYPGPWTTICLRRADRQDLVDLEDLARKLSRRLETQVLGVVVNDGAAVFCTSWDCGRRTDRFESVEGYFAAVRSRVAPGPVGEVLERISKIHGVPPDRLALAYRV